MRFFSYQVLLSRMSSGLAIYLHNDLNFSGLSKLFCVFFSPNLLKSNMYFVLTPSKKLKLSAHTCNKYTDFVNIMCTH